MEIETIKALIKFLKGLGYKAGIEMPQKVPAGFVLISFNDADRDFLNNNRWGVYTDTLNFTLSIFTKTLTDGLTAVSVLRQALEDFDEDNKFVHQVDIYNVGQDRDFNDLKVHIIEADITIQQ